MLQRRPHGGDQGVEVVPGRKSPHRADQPRAETAPLLARRHRGEERRERRRRPALLPPAHTALEGAVDAGGQVTTPTAPRERDREAGGHHHAARITEHGLERRELPVE
jgi:hypothetical protein